MSRHDDVLSMTPGLIARANRDRRHARPLRKDRLTGGIVAIGNAPTALLRLLELLAAGAPPPALILGVPVGFVNAAESKDLLARQDCPYITALGPKGGSALAASIVKALHIMALSEVPS